MNWPGVWTMVSVGPSTMSFRPEKTHAEFAWSSACVGPPAGGIAGVVSVLGFPGGPFTSPARAALALAPTSAAVQAAIPSNDLKRILTSNSEGPGSRKGTGAPSDSCASPTSIPDLGARRRCEIPQRWYRLRGIPAIPAARRLRGLHSAPGSHAPPRSSPAAGGRPGRASVRPRRRGRCPSLSPMTKTTTIRSPRSRTSRTSVRSPS